MVNMGEKRRDQGGYAKVGIMLSVVLAAVVFVGCVGAPASATHVPDEDVEEGRLARLTRTWDTESDPAWSPIGDRIAFECYDGIRYARSDEVMNRPIRFSWVPGNVCVMNADGIGRERLTDEEGDDSDPAWSPDGSLIAFSSHRDGHRDIWVMNADGSGLSRVTDDEPDDTGPTWSPDGSMIAYSSTRDENADIYIVNVDGSGIRRVSFDDGWNIEPSWSPDGSKIAFTSVKDDESDILVIEPEPGGKGKTLLHGWHSHLRGRLMEG